MSRAISTVVDTVVCLLLVTAAVFVVTTPVQNPEAVPDGDTAALLASSTTTVAYQVGDGERQVTHRARGTYAGLLGRAAVADATYDGQSLAQNGRGFAAAVRERTRSVLGANVQVSAWWAPYPGAPVAGEVTVGPEPPPRADVRVVRLTVPVTVPAAGSARSYEGIGRGVADAVTRGLLPGDTPGLSPGGGPYREAVDHRLGVLAGPERRAARAHLARGEAAAARELAAEALAGIIASDLRSRFDSPEAAARAVGTGTATVVVRRWTE